MMNYVCEWYRVMNGALKSLFLVNLLYQEEDV